MQFHKSRTTFIIVAIFVFISSLLLYLVNSGNLKIPDIFDIALFKQTPKVELPQTVIEVVESDTGAVWVWLENLSMKEESGKYYLYGNMTQSKDVTIKILVGSPERKVGYAFSQEVDSADEDFARFFPKWTLETSKTIFEESVNSDHAVVKIYTKQIVVEEDCNSSCQEFLAGQVLLQDGNSAITTVTNATSTKEIPIGPAVQILFFKLTK